MPKSYMKFIKQRKESDKLCAGRCLLDWFLCGNDDTVEQKSGSSSQCFF